MPDATSREMLDLETKFRIDYLLQQIAKRHYPPVFVVEMGSEQCLLVWKMGDHKLPDERRIEIARKTSIPVLSGLDVVQNLRGEMAEEEEWFLTGEVLDISAAKMGMICIQDDTPGRIARDGDIEECPLTRKLVPVEEVIRKDTETFWFFDQLQALVTDHEIPLIIPPTEKVLSFMKEHGEYWVCPVFTDWLPLRRGDTLEGYDLLLWMAENDVWPSKGKPYIRPILREPRGCAG